MVNGDRPACPLNLESPMVKVEVPIARTFDLEYAVRGNLEFIAPIGAGHIVAPDTAEGAEKVKNVMFLITENDEYHLGLRRSLKDAP